MGLHWTPPRENLSLLLPEPDHGQDQFLQHYGLGHESRDLPGDSHKLPVSLWLGKFVNEEAVVVVRVNEMDWSGTRYYLGFADRAIYKKMQATGEDPIEYVASTAITPVPDGSRSEAVRYLMELLRFTPELEPSPRDTYVLRYRAGN